LDNNICLQSEAERVVINKIRTVSSSSRPIIEHQAHCYRAFIKRNMYYVGQSLVILEMQL